MEFLGSLVSGLGSLVGGIFGSQAAKANAAKARDQQAATNAMQWDMWRHQTAYRVADANEAGINPLAALGASGNFSPSFAVGNTGVGGGAELGEGIKGLGQNLGRAITAATSTPSRADQLNEKLLEAKIANVEADTTRMLAASSAIATNMGQPGTAKVPFPTPDPRGPVIQLYQRARDYRTGDIIDIPSEKAASPLQTLAASPINLGMAARTTADAIEHTFGGGQAQRSSTHYDPDYRFYTPF